MAECQVAEKTDLDEDVFDMDFTNKLPSGVTLAASPDPTVTFLYPDGTAVDSGDLPAVSNYALDGDAKIWQMRITGGTNGKTYVIRVVAVKSDGLDVEGNGILRVRVPCVTT